MKFENIRVMNFANAIRGMRNPKDSWHLSDSRFGMESLEWCEAEYDVSAHWADQCGYNFGDSEWDNASDAYAQWLRDNGTLYVEDDIIEYAFIGPKDMKLALGLIHGGPEHRKFLRQIFVSMDITAPLYWWKEADTYKVGTTANSTSTMHTIINKPITLECFEIDDFNRDAANLCIENADNSRGFIENALIPYLESLRLKYIETSDKRYWKELIRWLPEGWLQTRTWTGNYENLYSMIHQREFHKQNEWSGKDDPNLTNFIGMVHTLPYADTLLFGESVQSQVAIG